MNGQRLKIAKLDMEERKHLMARGACFFCRKDGHLAKECPEKTTTQAVTSGTPIPPISQASTTTPPNKITQLRALLRELDEEAKEEAVKVMEEAGF